MQESIDEEASEAAESSSQNEIEYGGTDNNKKNDKSKIINERNLLSPKDKIFIQKDNVENEALPPNNDK